MKKEGHPPYQDVLFVDSSTGFEFVCGSTLQPKETKEFEGKEYPVYRVAVSSASHPFYTKSKKFVDSEGRVDKFMKRYKKKEAAPVEEATAEEKSTKEVKAKVAAPQKAPAKKAPAKKAPAKKADKEPKK